MTERWNNYINREFGTRILSRWVVFGFDIIITIFTYGVAYILRYNFNVAAISFKDYLGDTFLTTLLFGICFIGFKSFDGIIRHSGIADALRLIKAGLAATLLVIIISGLSKTYHFTPGILPVAIAIIHAALSISLLIFSRYGIKVFFYQANRHKITPIPVVIYGAGRRGLSVLQALKNDTNTNYSVIAFLDDNASKINKTIEGIKIYSSKKLSTLLGKYAVEELIIGINDIDVNRKNEVVAYCLENQISVKSVPPVTDWINGQLSLQQIKNINIEDLLGREPILLENENLKNNFSGKTILISGAAGSIGSEMVKQILKFQPGELILLDQAESALFDVKMDLFFKLSNINCSIVYVICDITNYKRLEQIITNYKPQIIFHAAAYKHVPLMEQNVIEAIDVNIFGTKNLVDLAIANAVEKFVMISTDKAVNPTNVMGATKRAAEIYVQDKSKDTSIKTVFTTTRFGNVLGSNGSVVNYFSKQIEAGGPLTITHPEVTRYFMTIAEACQLVLEAATMGKTSELYLFDMGEPVKIIDLARKMVLLSGLEPEKDIPFIFTGLRPGEKLHEELLNTNENTLPTHHHKIKIAITTQYPSEVVQTHINNLKLALNSGDMIQAVTSLKAFIPEFISKNSDFETLDQSPKTEISGSK